MTLFGLLVSLFHFLENFKAILFQGQSKIVQTLLVYLFSGYSSVDCVLKNKEDCHNLLAKKTLFLLTV